jgi:hypothetical protein
MAFGITSTGSFNNMDRFLNFLKGFSLGDILGQYGQMGVEALAAATPERTGLTAESWGYEVTNSGGDWKITWTNTNINEGVAIAILIQYGHGTGTGGYVQGYDFINPAIQPIFDQIANGVWKAVTSA